eukprot:5853072-Heterocapsa_arctica.AAC.1
MDHESDKQSLDQVHRYVHEGLLQRETQAEVNVVGIEIDQGNEEHEQHNAGDEQEQEVAIETQEQ